MAEMVTRIKEVVFRNNDLHAIGKPIERGKADRERADHLIVYVLLRKPKAGYFLQMRSAQKNIHPNLLTVSVSGHVMHGETVKEAARRETKEELGVDLDRLHFIFRKPERLDSKKPYLLFVPLLATYRGEIAPNPREINPEKSEFASRKRIFNLLQNNPHKMTPGARKFFQRVMRRRPE